MNPTPNDHDTLLVNGLTFTFKNIRDVVEEFYSQIPHDTQLKVPFSSVHDWPEHIARLTHFWWIRFGGKPYMFSEYNPVLKHYYAGFNEELLERWLGLFQKTLMKNLNEEQAHLWATIAQKMGKGLSIRNEMLHKHYEQKKSLPSE